MKRIRIAGLCLTGLCLMSVSAFGTVASASATEVLYELSKGAFPATFKSEGKETSTLETVGKEKISCKETKDEGSIGGGSETKSAHLGTVNITFTGCTALGGLAKCQSGSTSGEIKLSSVVYHLGLADPGDIPAQLLLIPTGFSFKCSALGIEEEVKVTGEVIGELQNAKGETAKAGESAKEGKLVFAQEKGKQKYTEFLLSLTKPENELMTKQQLASAKGGGASEQSGQSSNDTLKEYKNSAGEAVEIKLVTG
jgi:hypothetical protein